MHIPPSRYISQSGETVTVGKLKMRAYCDGELEPSQCEPGEPPDYVWVASGSVGITLGEQSVSLDNFITGWWRRENGDVAFEFDTVDSRIVNACGDEVDEVTLTTFFESAGGECELYWAIDEAIVNLCEAVAPSALAALESAVEEWLEESGNPPPAVAS